MVYFTETFLSDPYCIYRTGHSTIMVMDRIVYGLSNITIYIYGYILADIISVGEIIDICPLTRT